MMTDFSLKQSGCAVTLKEWMIVCDAIKLGKQQLLFRTGGLEELETGFQTKHSEFWLFPTRFHQTHDLITPEFAKSVEANQAVSEKCLSGNLIPIDLYCKVVAVHHVTSMLALHRLRAWHVITDDVLKQRFHYRTPGLFVLVIDAYRADQPCLIPNIPKYQGCKSWVELDQPIKASSLTRIRTSSPMQDVVDQVAEIVAATPGDENLD